MSFIPNFVTLCNFFCGVGAIFFAYQGNTLLSAHLIFIGMLLDFFDGKIARFTNSVSELGKYLDSASDVVTFGIAPAVLIYYVSPDIYSGGLIWALVLYSISGILRLARYTFDPRVKKKDVFLGLPIPAAAGALTGFILVYLYTGSAFPYVVITCLLILMAILMVSTFPYKHLSRILEILPNPIRILLLLISLTLILLGYYYFVLFLYFTFYTILGVKWRQNFELKGQENHKNPSA